MSIPIYGADFGDEARASLLALSPSGTVLEVNEVFEAVALQRLRLRQDQQVPEWNGDVVR